MNDPAAGETERCQLCGRFVPLRLITLHHLTPREKGGRLDTKTPLCKLCHKQVHATFTNTQLARELADLPRLPIRWGHSISRRKRTSIRLGSYDHRTGEIRIHPSLNAQWVPRFFVESVIHHEYLHHVLGPDHDRRFRAFERRFRFHRESQLWLKRHLPVLLGRRERPTPPPRPVPVASPGQQLALF